MERTAVRVLGVATGWDWEVTELLGWVATLMEGGQDLIQHLSFIKLEWVGGRIKGLSPFLSFGWLL